MPQLLILKQHSDRKHPKKTTQTAQNLLKFWLESLTDSGKQFERNRGRNQL